MSTLVIFYSYTGRTRAHAARIAKETGAELCEVRAQKKQGKLAAYVGGVFAAMRGDKAAIEPIGVELARYDRLIVMGPVWAGKPAPAVNSILDAVPFGKQVEVRLVSASGTSKCKDDVLSLLEKKGCASASFTTIKR